MNEQTNHYDCSRPGNLFVGYEQIRQRMIKGLKGAIGSKRVTYDFARQMEGAAEIKCSEFGENIIAHM